MKLKNVSIILLSLSCFPLLAKKECFYALKSKELTIYKNLDNPEDSKFSIGIRVAGTYFDYNRRETYLSALNFHQMKVPSSKLGEAISLEGSFSVPLANVDILPEFKLNVEIIDIDDFMSLTLGLHGPNANNQVVAKKTLSLLTDELSWNQDQSTLEFSMPELAELSFDLKRSCR